MYSKKSYIPYSKFEELVRITRNVTGMSDFKYTVGYSLHCFKRTIHPSTYGESMDFTVAYQNCKLILF